MVVEIGGGIEGRACGSALKLLCMRDIKREGFIWEGEDITACGLLYPLASNWALRWYVSTTGGQQNSSRVRGSVFIISVVYFHGN